MKRNPKQLEPKRKRLRNANWIIGGCGCAGFLYGMMFLLATLGITNMLMLPALIACFGVIPLCYNLHRVTGSFKWLLYLARTAGIALFAMMFLAPVVVRNFARIPLLYRVKRFVFTEGVRNPAVGDVLLPHTLPALHEDYYFYTEPQTIAQDDTPFAYLFLHTDEETLRDYEASLQGNEHLERKKNKPYSEDSIRTGHSPYNETSVKYQNLPGFVYAMMTDPDRAGITDDLSHAVVYQGDNSGTWHVGSGALINYETGLLIVWL